MEVWFSEAKNGGPMNPLGFANFDLMSVMSKVEQEFVHGIVDGTIAPSAYMILFDRPKPGGLSRTHSHLHRHPMFTPLYSYLWTRQREDIVIDAMGETTFYAKYTPYQTFYTKFVDHRTMMLSNITVSTSVKDGAYMLIERPPITMNQPALFLPANVIVRVRYEIVWKGSRVFAVSDLEQGHLARYNLYDAEYLQFLSPKEEFAYRLKHRCGT
jgi:hypothetical protein